MDTTIPDPSFVLQVLRANQDDIARLGVKSLAIFGSVARNDAGPTSDVDILVEFSRPVGLFDFIAVKETLETLLQHPVDLVTPDALRPTIKDRILIDAIYA